MAENPGLCVDGTTESAVLFNDDIDKTQIFLVIIARLN